MTVNRTRSTDWAVLAFLPMAMFVAGSVSLSLVSRQSVPLNASVRWSFIVAAIAPLLAIAVCRTLHPRIDIILLGTGFMLSTIGMLSLAGLALQPGADRAFFTSFVERQGLFIGAGSAALVAGVVLASRLDVVARYPYSLAALALALTAVTIIAGTTVNGARLWLSLGPLSFQPSEIARILVVGFAASFLHERRHLVAATWRLGPLDLPPAPYLVPLACAAAAAGALLALQNDLGMAAILTLGVVTATVSTMRSRLAAASSVILIGLAMVASYGLSSRIQDRVAGWLDAWQIAGGSGYQFVQGDYALANGGIVGAGARAGAVVVPEVQTDFILTAIGNQFGILAAAAVIALSCLIVLRCVVNALRASSGLGALFCSCLAVLFGIQLMLITGGSLRVLPLTGVTFPLVSYGGTSMIATLFVLGLVAGIGAEQCASRFAPVPKNA